MHYQKDNNGEWLALGERGGREGGYGLVSTSKEWSEVPGVMEREHQASRVPLSLASQPIWWTRPAYSVSRALNAAVPSEPVSLHCVKVGTVGSEGALENKEQSRELSRVKEEKLNLKTLADWSGSWKQIKKCIKSKSELRVLTQEHEMCPFPG